MMPLSYKSLNRQWLTSPQYAQARMQAQQAQLQMMALYSGQSTAPTYTAATAVTTTATALYGGMIGQGDVLVRDIFTVRDGDAATINLPDGSVIGVAQDGSFTITDTGANVIYRANRMRDFNPFINASDKLEGFIKYCGAQGVRQGEMLDLPIKLFIGWLILQAAMADGENPEPDNLLQDMNAHVKPRCTCGRFLPRKLAARKVPFCRPVCLERELEAA